MKMHAFSCIFTENAKNKVFEIDLSPNKGLFYERPKQSSHMALKEVNWVHNDKIRSNGLERSNLGTQYKNQVKWS